MPTYPGETETNAKDAFMAFFLAAFAALSNPALRACKRLRTAAISVMSR
ncbi:hypothetical protein ABZX98_32730 [Streptomyces sp. NPDC002992]